ncbi:hypothetical protein CAC42_967 [Sphaceloma murrayae]|uniref:Uncharacterized protein n=1 Tax=Sphaceloma murrayae TaxID=2082308 RepID=A0A2K1R2U0_9PEZI|nr:hypothetical protein CAC42_967 [Sphaceloma murrayae]
MGTVSSTVQLAPVSLGSSIIGFISFAFTFATFLRVFWQNLTTLFKAGRESKNILTTLRTELEEERSCLREIKRHQRSRGPTSSQDVFQGPELDDVAIRSLQSTVKRLTKRFEDFERPFLANEEEFQRRKERRRRRSSRGRTARRPGDASHDYEKGTRHQPDGYESEDDKVEDLYSTISLRRRLTWLNTRSEALGMLDAVNRVQTRRIARQVGEIACMLHQYKNTLEDLRHGVAITEDRMSRVVGLRRIN